MLGLEAGDGRLVCPHLPPEAGRIRYRGVHALGRRWDVEAEGGRGEVGPAG